MAACGLRPDADTQRTPPTPNNLNCTPQIEKRACVRRSIAQAQTGSKTLLQFPCCMSVLRHVYKFYGGSTVAQAARTHTHAVHSASRVACAIHSEVSHWYRISCQIIELDAHSISDISHCPDEACWRRSGGAGGSASARVVLGRLRDRTAPGSGEVRQGVSCQGKNFGLRHCYQGKTADYKVNLTIPSQYRFLLLNLHRPASSVVQQLRDY